MIDKYINKILPGDCLELFKDIPDESVDVTFADPPFNLKKNITTIEIARHSRIIYLGAKSGLLKW
jgi:site-specific DNA-methyltransferase (adenine-specific)